MPPVKNPCVMTSYGGIIRIRLKGRSSVTSSQPASQAPLYLFHLLVYTRFCKNKCLHKIYSYFYPNDSHQEDAGKTQLEVME